MQAVLLIPWFHAEVTRLELLGVELAIDPYRVAIGTAAAVVIATALVFAHRRGRSVEATISLLFYVMTFALVFSLIPSAARVFRSADPFSLSALSHELQWNSVTALPGGILGALVWGWRGDGPWVETLDSVAFAMPFGWWIGRLGCFGVHDHPGRISHFALAVADFEYGSPPYPPRHDMALYDAIGVFAIAVLFAALARRPRKPGFYVGAFLLLYTPMRFFLDFLRLPQEEGGYARYLGLDGIQYAALAFFFAGLFVARAVHTRGAIPVEARTHT